MMQVLAVALGGALGTVLRYAFQKWLNVTYPFGTLAVNLLGCFLTGWIWAKSISDINQLAFLFMMTGFCGGFTTFSAFSVENLQMMLSGNWPAAVFYIVISLIGGLLAAYLGYKLFTT